MRQADAKATLRELGLVLKKTDYGEWRVNFKGGPEKTAYYTSDLADAVGTGRAMAKKMGTSRRNPLAFPRKRNPLRMNPTAAEHAVLAKAAQRHLSGVIAAAYAALKRPGGAATLFELGAAYEGLRREISYPGVAKPPGAAATLAGAKRVYALLAKHVG